jgi:hypothetical protein
VEVVDGTDGVVTAGFVVVVVGLVVVVGGLVVVFVGGTVVVLDGAVVAVFPELDAPDEDADDAALTAAVPAINEVGNAIKVIGMRTLSARGGRRAGRRRACRAVEVPNRLIAPLRNGNHAHCTCGSFHGPPGQPGISVNYGRK